MSWTRDDKKDPVKKRFKKNVSDLLRLEWDVDNVIDLDDIEKEENKHGERKEELDYGQIP